MSKLLENRKEKKLGKVFVEDLGLVNRLDELLQALSEKSGLDYNSLVQLFQKRQQYLSITPEVFDTSLSPLETLTLYLHLKFNLTQSQIAVLLKRDHTTIWTTLDNALKKVSSQQFKHFINNTKGTILIPISTFSQRKLSILESLCVYLKEEHELTYHEIAVLLGKNDRTVWTVVSRAKKKLKK